MITEESGELDGTDQDVQWVIDPLDGTTNFIKRLPHFAVSIAVRIKGRTEVAVVYDPMRNELFTATRGQGAQLNGYRLRGSTARRSRRYDSGDRLPVQSKTVRHYLHQHRRQTVQRMCRLPSYRFRGAGFWLTSLRFALTVSLKSVCAVDFAAGELLVREAGDIVSDFTGGHNYMLTGNIVAGNPRVVKAMPANMRDESSDALKRQ
ncbi:inositol monophosphatase family protein [Escherichia coli]